MNAKTSASADPTVTAPVSPADDTPAEGKRGAARSSSRQSIQAALRKQSAVQTQFDPSRYRRVESGAAGKPPSRRRTT